MALNLRDELLDQLLTLGIIVPAELEKLQREAEEAASELEIVLRKRRILSDPQLHSLKAIRAGSVYCNLSDYIPRLRNAELVPEELARRHAMFALFQLDDVITSPWTYRDGAFELPSGPGLGVELDRDKLDFYHRYYLEHAEVNEFFDPYRPDWVPALPLF